MIYCRMFSRSVSILQATYTVNHTHSHPTILRQYSDKNNTRLLQQIRIDTEWGKISSVLSVGHCEGRGGRGRVGLFSKDAGSYEVPVTTLRSRKDGVVQRAARICRRNLLSAKSLYRSGAACVPYSLPIPPSGPSTGPKIHSVVGWELQGNGKCIWKKVRTTTDLSNTRELRGCQTVRFAVSQALCTQRPRKKRPPLAR